MKELEDLRVCMDCGTVFSKKPSSMKLILKCPHCNSRRRRSVVSKRE